MLNLRFYAFNKGQYLDVHRMKVAGQHLYLLATCLLLAEHVTAIPLDSFYPYGAGTGDSLVQKVDDGSSPAISLPLRFSFFAQSFGIIYVSFYITNKSYCSGLACVSYHNFL